MKAIMLDGRYPPTQQLFIPSDASFLAGHGNGAAYHTPAFRPHVPSVHYDQTNSGLR